MKTLILFSTRDGQTREIASYLASELKELGIQTDVANVHRIEEPQWENYDRVVIGASIRYGHYHSAFQEFVKKHATRLNSMPSAFYSVNLVARKPEKRTPQTNSYARKFLMNSQWRPDRCAVIAGALRYPRYRWYDRFMIKLSMGYPDPASEVAILKDRQGANPLNDVKQVVDGNDIITMQEETDNLHMDDAIIEYITMLSFATRQNPLIELGVSPRGSIALAGMSKAKAYISGRTYVTPEDVQSIFKDVAGHRIILNPRAKISSVTIDEVIDNIFRTVPVPRTMR